MTQAQSFNVVLITMLIDFGSYIRIDCIISHNGLNQIEARSLGSLVSIKKWF